MNLEALKNDLARSLSDRAVVGIGGVGIGIFTSDGRQAGAKVEVGAAGALILSDAGETWSDLWMDGHVHGAPTASEKEKLQKICAMYNVQWDQERRRIVCMCDHATFADGVRRISAASIAIDGWRVWLQGRAAGHATRIDSIVKGVEQLAQGQRWDFTNWMPVRGRRRTWRARGGLTRSGRQAAFTFLHDTDPEAAVERATGWILDTTVPLIFVVNEAIVPSLADDHVFAERAVVVPRLRTGTAEAIMQAAELLAA